MTRKLVRDLIPEIINRSGRTPSYHQAGDNEFKDLLKKKLREEVHEFIESESVEELADILEVIDAITVAYQIDKEELLTIKQKKKKRAWVV